MLMLLGETNNLTRLERKSLAYEYEIISSFNAVGAAFGRSISLVLF
jgi:hypothetical protein